MQEAERLQKLPVYVFARLDKLKAEEVKKGVDLIDLGMGNPNISPPPDVKDAMIHAMSEGENHRYPYFEGAPEFKQAVSDWCKRQYNINIDPEHEVATLIGSKEGVIHLIFAYINPGDVTLSPIPAYPAHFRGTILAGGEPYALEANEQNNYMPDLDKIDPAVIKKAKILILSYPTNPTAACATKEYFEKAVAFAKKHKIILVHDFAYAEVYFSAEGGSASGGEGEKPLSMLSIKGAKDVCIEFHTLSKTFGMPGWRIGFAVGNRQIIETLKKIKTNLDYGVFTAVQKGAIAALRHKNGYIERMRKTYQKRRDIFVDGLNSLGWNIKKPKATMYIWFPVPTGYNSTDFSLEILQKTGVVFAPGTAFGDLGEGFVRAAMVDTDERIAEAIERIRKAGIKFK